MALLIGVGMDMDMDREEEGGGRGGATVSGTTSADVVALLHLLLSRMAFFKCVDRLAGMMTGPCDTVVDADTDAGASVTWEGLGAGVP